VSTEHGIPLHDLLDFEFVSPPDGSTAAEVRMPIGPGSVGPTGNLHGGAIATLVDLASALAAAKATGFDLQRESLITTDMHVRYLGRPRTDGVVARSSVVRLGRQLVVVDCDVVDDDGHLVAAADVALMVVPLRRPLAAVEETALEPGEGAQ